MQDALTKTIPIWAAVVNRAVLQLRSTASDDTSNTAGSSSWDTNIHLPPWISKNEKNQIEQRIDGWVHDLSSLGIDLSSLVKTMIKPLRCIWISQDDEAILECDWEDLADKKEDLDFLPIVLISASIPNARKRRRLILDPEDHSLPDSDVGNTCRTVYDDVIDIMYDYIPGAGDDEESWAKGLTPALMWAHAAELLLAGPEDVGNTVQRLVKTSQKGHSRTGAGSRIAGGGGGNLKPWDIKWIGNCLALGISTSHLMPEMLNTPTLEVSSEQGIQSSTIPSSFACLNVGFSEPDTLKQLFDPGDTPSTDREDVSLDSLHYKWLAVAGDKQPKLAVLRAAHAAVEFISRHIAAGRKVLVVAEPENIDIAAAVLLTSLIACFKLEGSSESASASGASKGGVLWSRKCQIYSNTTRQMIPVVDNDDYSRVTIRQYLAVVSSYYPQVVLSQSLLRQVFNAFLPTSMTPPPPLDQKK